MMIIRRRAILLLLGLALVASATAQTVEAEIAIDFVLVAGRLSVTFTDTTLESDAQDLLRERGYEVLQTTFQPVMVTGQLSEFLPDERLAVLRAHALVEQVQQTQQDTLLIFSLSSTLSSEEAKVLVQTLCPEITIQKVQKMPHEAIISVAEGHEGEAIALHEALPEVRFVAYINAF